MEMKQKDFEIGYAIRWRGLVFWFVTPIQKLYIYKDSEIIAKQENKKKTLKLRYFLTKNKKPKN